MFYCTLLYFLKTLLFFERSLAYHIGFVSYLNFRIKSKFYLITFVCNCIHACKGISPELC